MGQVSENDSTRSSATRLRVISTRPNSEMCIRDRGYTRIEITDIKVGSGGKAAADTESDDKE